MVEIGHTFRSGWNACAVHNNGDVYSAEDEERHLQAAWDEYCGTSTPAPHPLTPEAFVDDWNAMIATVSETCTRHNLRKPDMVFHPEWLEAMRALSGQRISSTLIHTGVRVKFATFEQATVIREI